MKYDDMSWHSDGDFPEDLAAVRERKITGRDFLIRNCDGKLTDEDLNDQGNTFAAKYLEDDYTNDYLEIVPDELGSIYHLEDSWENFDKLKIQKMAERRLLACNFMLFASFLFNICL